MPMNSGSAARRWWLLAAMLVVPAVASSAFGRSGKSDMQMLAEVQKSLDGKRFVGVHATVHKGTVTLTGTVDLYATKEDAAQKIHHKRGVVTVSNLITISGAADTSPAADLDLRNRLAEKLAYVRIGYGTTAFNSFTVGVQSGVVTLGGVAYGPIDRDAAVSLVANSSGVRDIVDDIEVAPVSPNDDRIRVEAARAIYGFPQLSRYALDPAKPIRITVVDGNITLTGVVDSTADKDAAGIRANGVSGAFKVTNDLQLADRASEAR